MNLNNIGHQKIKRKGKGQGNLPWENYNIREHSHLQQSWAGCIYSFWPVKLTGPCAYYGPDGPHPIS